MYQFAYVFKYVLDVDGAETITLPNDSDILVFAATAIEGATTKAAAPLYDAIDTDVETHTLTVKIGDKIISTQTCAKGSKVLLRTAELGDSGLFERWTGNGKIIHAAEQYAIVEMGDEDIVMIPAYTNIGENVILNKPCKANGQTGEDEGPAKAINGSDTDKWCTEWGKDHLCWMEVDIGDPTFIDKWIVCHAGQHEDTDWNTYDFALQYRTYENEEWKCADAVVANTENLTYRHFNPVMARFVRLLITLPGLPGDDEQRHFARIYQFRVYKANSN